MPDLFDRGTRTVWASKDSAAGDPKATPAIMVVVLNWLEALKQRVSVNRN